MKNTIQIDFSDIHEYIDFYTQLKQKLALPDYFGDNLDALYDSLTGDVEMPLQIEFIEISPGQIMKFKELIFLMEDVEDYLDEFTFCYSVKLSDEIDPFWEEDWEEE